MLKRWCCEPKRGTNIYIIHRHKSRKGHYKKKVITYCQVKTKFSIFSDCNCVFFFSSFFLKVKEPESSSFISFPIHEKEELERIGYMVQRDNLLRNFGIPDLVYRLLHGIKPHKKPQIVGSSGKEVNVYSVSLKPVIMSLLLVHIFILH